MKLKTIILTALVLFCVPFSNAKKEPEDESNRVEKLAEQPCDGIRVVGVGRSTTERTAKAMCLREAQREASLLLSTAVENASKSYDQEIGIDDDVFVGSITETLLNTYSANIVSLKKIGTPLKLTEKSSTGKKLIVYYQCYETVNTTDEIVDEVADAAETLLKKNSKTKEMLLKDRDKFEDKLKSELEKEAVKDRLSEEEDNVE